MQVGEIHSVYRKGTIRNLGFQFSNTDANPSAGHPGHPNTPGTLSSLGQVFGTAPSFQQMEAGSVCTFLMPHGPKMAQKE